MMHQDFSADLATAKSAVSACLSSKFADFAHFARILPKDGRAKNSPVDKISLRSSWQSSGLPSGIGS
jgi:hypothetical protein